MNEIKLNVGELTRLIQVKICKMGVGPFSSKAGLTEKETHEFLNKKKKFSLKRLMEISKNIFGTMEISVKMNQMEVARELVKEIQENTEENFKIMLFLQMCLMDLFNEEQFERFFNLAAKTRKNALKTADNILKTN